MQRKQMTIKIVFTLFLIQTPLILSNNSIRCFPPFAYIQDSKCVQSCSDNYLVEQGTNICKKNDANCQIFSEFRGFLQKENPFCSRSQNDQITNTYVSTIQGCQGGKIPNYMTGICELPTEIKQKSISEFGAFNSEETAYFDQKYLENLLQSRSPPSQSQNYFKTLISLKCEVIDLIEKKCIEKSICIEKNRNIKGFLCVETCSEDEISVRNNCVLKTEANPSYFNQGNNPGQARNEILCWEKINQTGGCGTCSKDQVYLDFQTGEQYCSDQQGNNFHISNKLDQLITSFNPSCEVGSEGCYQFCTEDNYLNREKQKLEFVNRLVECDDEHDTEFGIFRIKSDDCPFSLEYDFIQYLCKKRCSSLKKPVFNKNQISECVECGRPMIQGGGCSDHCKINETYDGKLCVRNDIGPFSFQFNSTTSTFECKFPRMLSLDSSSCVDQCQIGQIPTKFGTSEEYQCQQKGNSSPQPIAGFLLSSDETSYVKDCIFIHEIKCQNKCIKRTDPQVEGCEQTADQAIKEIQKKMDELFKQMKGPHFLIPEIKQFLKEGFSFEEIKLSFLNLIDFTFYFFDNYALYVNDDGEQLIVANERKTIIMKFAHLPNNGSGKFNQEINFNASKDVSTKIQLIQSEKEQFNVLSLSHFDKHYQICKTQDNCYDLKFIFLQIRLNSNSIYYNVVFNLDENELKQPTEENSYFCLIDDKIEPTRVIMNQGKNSIECNGINFIGYFYGPTLDKKQIVYRTKPLNQNQGSSENLADKNSQNQGTSSDSTDNNSQNQGTPSDSRDNNSLNQGTPSDSRDNNSLNQGKPKDSTGNNAQNQGKPKDSTGNNAQNQGKPKDSTGNNAQNQGGPQDSTDNKSGSSLQIYLIVVGVTVVGLIVAFVVFIIIKHKKSRNQNTSTEQQ